MPKEITLHIEVDNDNMAGAVAVIQAAVNAQANKKGLLEVRVGPTPLNPTTFNTAHP